jgi:hypothetical protein
MDLVLYVCVIVDLLFVVVVVRVTKTSTDMNFTDIFAMSTPPKYPWALVLYSPQVKDPAVPFPRSASTIIALTVG